IKGKVDFDKGVYIDELVANKFNVNVGDHIYYQIGNKVFKEEITAIGHQVTHPLYNNGVIISKNYINRLNDIETLNYSMAFVKVNGNLDDAILDIYSSLGNNHSIITKEEVKKFEYYDKFDLVTKYCGYTIIVLFIIAGIYIIKKIFTTDKQ
ncbi:MAG: hypothetical protein ACRC5M_03680, partial [Anaeroplasmataceae bacterium]